MKNKTFLFGAFFSAFLMLMMPCINAVDMQTSEKKLEERDKNIEKIIKTDYEKTELNLFNAIELILGLLLGISGTLLSPILFPYFSIGWGILSFFTGSGLLNGLVEGATMYLNEFIIYPFLMAYDAIINIIS